MTNWPWADLRPYAYDFIMADPNWRFETWSEKGREGNRAVENHYKTDPVGAIVEKFPINLLAAKNCLLWLWATHPMLGLQIECGLAWGFTYSTSGVWVKRTKNNKLGFGTGYRLRSASEPFLIFTKGKPKTTRSIRTVVEGPVREHSRKPDEAYRAAEKMMPDAVRRADLFSRQRRRLWEGFGDELDLFPPER